MRGALAIVACVPAVLIVAWFARKWHGLTPPLFQNEYRAAPEGANALASLVARSNPASPAYILAQFGFFGAFYLGSFWPGLASLWRERRGVLIGLVLLALALALAPATTLDPEGGRGLGLWKQASHRVVPVIAGHSNTLIVGLAALGMLVLVGLLRRVSRREAIIVVVALLGFAAAQAASFHLWQRYSAPFVLAILALLACRASPVEAARSASSRAGLKRVRSLGIVAGPLLLALVQGAYTLKLAWRDAPQARWEDEELLRDLYPRGGGPDHLRMDPSDPAMPGTLRPPGPIPDGASPEPRPPAAGDASPMERR